MHNPSHTVLLVVATMMCLCVSCEPTNGDTSRLSGLNAEVRFQGYQAIRQGISRYERSTGRTFAESGKYFLDSLLPYVRIDTLIPYIYQDSVHRDRDVQSYGLMEGDVGRRTHRLYFGIGDAFEYIRHRLDTATHEHILYTVGMNGKDEHGSGDDILLPEDR